MLLTILFAFCAWTMIIFSCISFCMILTKGTNHVRTLHKIPCSGCDFFTNDYRLKCTIHPYKACSEEAIDCIDFEVKTANCNAYQKCRRKLC